MGPAVAGAATAGHRRGREEGKGREGGEKEGEGKGRGAGERASRGDWKPTNTTAIATAASAPLSGHHTKRPLNARAPSPRRASPPTYGSPAQPANPCVALPSPAYRSAAPLSVTGSPPSAVDSSPRPALLPPPPLQSRFHTLASPCSLTRDSPCSPSTSAIHFFPAPRLFPVCCPPPLVVSPRPTPQWRSRQPLERHVGSANHCDPLAPTSVFGRRWTGALPGARWLRWSLCAEPARYPDTLSTFLGLVEGGG